MHKITMKRVGDPQRLPIDLKNIFIEDDNEMATIRNFASYAGHGSE